MVLIELSSNPFELVFSDEIRTALRTEESVAVRSGGPREELERAYYTLEKLSYCVFDSRWEWELDLSVLLTEGPAANYWEHPRIRDGWNWHLFRLIRFWIASVDRLRPVVHWNRGHFHIGPVQWGTTFASYAEYLLYAAGEWIPTIRCLNEIKPDLNLPLRCFRDLKEQINSSLCADGSTEWLEREANCIIEAIVAVRQDISLYARLLTEWTARQLAIGDGKETKPQEQIRMTVDEADPIVAHYLKSTEKPSARGARNYILKRYPSRSCALGTVTKCPSYRSHIQARKASNPPSAPAVTFNEKAYVAETIDVPECSCEFPTKCDGVGERHCLGCNDNEHGVSGCICDCGGARPCDGCSNCRERTLNALIAEQDADYEPHPCDSQPLKNPTCHQRR